MTGVKAEVQLGSAMTKSVSPSFDVTKPAQPAKRIESVLALSEIYKSGAKLTVAVAVFSAVGGRPTAQTKVVLVAKDPAGKKLLEWSTIVSAGSQWRGLATASVPAGLFSTGTDNILSIKAHLEGKEGEAVAVGDVKLMRFHAPAPATDFAQQRLAMELPYHTLFAGETFTATAYTHTNKPLTSFGALFMVNKDGLAITKVDCGVSKSAPWTAQVKLSPAQESASAGGFRDAPKSDPRVDGREALCRVTFEVKSQAQPGTYSITMKMDDDKDTGNGAAISGSGQGPLFFVRDGKVTNGKAFVHVAAEAAAGIFTQAAGSNYMVNTAKLSGVKVKAALVVTQITNRRRQSAVTRQQGLACSADKTGSLKVTDEGQGYAAMLDGTEAGGAVSAAVTCKYSGKESKQTFRVWYPTLPLQLALAQSTPLKKIKGWMEPPKCGQQAVQKFQSSKFSATATFTDGSGSGGAFDADVTTLVKTYSLSNFAVADVSKTTAVVSALSPGTTKMTAKNGITTLGTVDITAADEFVAVCSFHAVAVKDFKVDRTTKRLGSHDESTVCATPVGSPVVLEFEKERAHIVAVARFTDGTQMHITDKDTLSMATLDKDSIVVDQGVYAKVPQDAISSPFGPKIKVTWTPKCSKTTIQETTAWFAVNLPLPQVVSALPTSKTPPASGV